MKLILCKTLDDDNVINKTLTDAFELDIFLRADTDITDPQLPMARVPGIEYTDFNYAQLPELGRSYFIREWSMVNASIVRLGLNLDYLETYKAQILAAEGTFNRAVKAGDYGDLTLETTGRTTDTLYHSNITLDEGGDGLLTLIKPE